MYFGGHRPALRVWWAGYRDQPYSLGVIDHERSTTGRIRLTQQDLNETSKVQQQHVLLPHGDPSVSGRAGRRRRAPRRHALHVRPIRPEDAEIERAFVAGLSEETRYFRFFYQLHELTPSMLARFTQVDYDREMALWRSTRSGGAPAIVGVARYIMRIRTGPRPSSPSWSPTHGMGAASRGC